MDGWIGLEAETETGLCLTKPEGERRANSVLQLLAAANASCSPCPPRWCRMTTRLLCAEAGEN